eukprot:6204715-Pleurochrysis_carterae.AAC.1
MSCPTPELLNTARRVLYYLSHHRHVGLRYALFTLLPESHHIHTKSHSHKCAMAFTCKRAFNLSCGQATRRQRALQLIGVLRSI